MKKIITSAALLLSTFVGGIAHAGAPYMAVTTVPQISTYEERFESNVSEVMRMNGIDRVEAIGRIRHALDSQNGRVGFSKEIAREYGSTYNPAPNAFMQGVSQYYAGLGADGRHVFTNEQRAQVLEGGSYRYCPVGTVFTFTIEKSFCK